MTLDVKNTGPLAGVVVLDLTSVMMGPHCTQILGDMGADVIKVESPIGDNSRQGDIGKSPGLPANFLVLNRNKRSIVIDLKNPEGRKALLRMAAKADVLVHNLRPHTIEGLGLGYPVLKEANPGLIVCGMYGFGSRGRYAAKAAYDDIIQGASGFAMLQEKIVGRPAYLPSVIADKVAGMAGANAIAMALFHKQRTGQGQQVEVPMFETMSAFVLLEHLMGQAFVPPISPPVYARVVSPFRRPYKTATGYLAVLVYNNKQWAAFLKLIGRPELIDSEMFKSMASRLRHIDKVYGFVEETLQTRSAEEWMPLLEEAEIPVMPVHSIESLLQDPHLEDVGFFREIVHDTEGAMRFPDVATRYSETPGTVRRMAPRLGENSREILEQFGFGEADVGALLDSKAVVQHTRAGK
jgi:crotonobetainyl-CoA:carnitine CoA-transferase CaiB-like acyl-CoA transferase